MLHKSNLKTSSLRGRRHRGGNMRVPEYDRPKPHPLSIPKARAEEAGVLLARGGGDGEQCDREMCG